MPPPFNYLESKLKEEFKMNHTRILNVWILIYTSISTLSWLGFIINMTHPRVTRKEVPSTEELP